MYRAVSCDVIFRASPFHCSHVSLCASMYTQYSMVKSTFTVQLNTGSIRPLLAISFSGVYCLCIDCQSRDSQWVHVWPHLAPVNV